MKISNLTKIYNSHLILDIENLNIDTTKIIGLTGSNGSGAEVDGFNKTLTSLDISISSKTLVYVVIFMTIVLLISLIISSTNILRKNPKELLIDTK